MKRIEQRRKEDLNKIWELLYKLANENFNNGVKHHDLLQMCNAISYEIGIINGIELDD